MKKFFFVLLVMSLISVAAKAQQIDFVASPLAHETSSVTMSQTHVYAFVPGQLYCAPIAKTLEWQGLTILPSNSPAITSGFVEDKLFVLLENGELYSFIEGAWTLEKEGIEVMSVNDHGVFAWNETSIYQYSYTWINELNCPGVNYVTASNRDIVVIANNREIFHGPTLEHLELFGQTEINVNKYLIASSYYAYVGSHFMSAEAAYHVSPAGICVPIDHVLTNGTLHDLVEFNDRIYIAGQLGAKGVVFDAHDMSTLNTFSSPITGLCANDYAIAAWSGETLYLSVNQTMAIVRKDHFANEFTVLVNPVEDILKIVSSNTMEVKIISLNGKIMSYHFLRPGINNINTVSWPAGVYFIASPIGNEKFMIR